MGKAFFKWFAVCLWLCVIAFFGFAGLAAAHTVLFHGEAASPNRLVVSVLAIFCEFMAVLNVSCLWGFLKVIKGT